MIRRDVCVIGGGSAGTYTAVRLGDLGRSVVVVEAKDRLGGHTETYHDPVTGGTVDIGVIVLHGKFDPSSDTITGHFVLRRGRRKVRRGTFTLTRFA